MIVQNAFGQEQAVENLLKKTMIQMNHKEIQDWMKSTFHPQEMFCFYEEDILVSVLQIRHTQLKFKEYTISLSAIVLAATLPDYQNRGYFKSLLDAYLDQASHNELLSYVYTKTPKLFESRSFGTISNTKEYWISENTLNSGSTNHVSLYKGKESLYPLYKEFLNHFDGSILYTEKEFQEILSLWKTQKKQIMVAKNEQGKITGFACFEKMNDYLYIHAIVYLNSKALLDILSYALLLRPRVRLITSQYERINKLLNVDKPKKHASCMFRLNNYKLLSELYKSNLRNLKQAFDLIDKPMWNHLI